MLMLSIFLFLLLFFFVNNCNFVDKYKNKEWGELASLLSNLGLLLVLVPILHYRLQGPDRILDSYLLKVLVKVTTI